MARYQITDSTEAYKISNDLVDSINKFKILADKKHNKHAKVYLIKEEFE